MDKYNELVKNIASAIKKEGFIKNGDSFYLNKENNWAIINFQKSVYSDNRVLKFTINLGTASTTLRKFGGEEIEIKPKIENCHWRRRIGFLMPQKDDYW